MRLGSAVRRGLGCAFWVFSVGWLLAACAPRLEMPAPVVSGGAAAGGQEWVTVQRGDSLSVIAQAHHMPMRTIAEANGLPPPYRIQVGRRLLIPGSGQALAPAPVSVAALPASAPASPMASPPAPDTAAAVPLERPPITAAPLPPVGSPAPPAVASAAEPPRAALAPRETPAPPAPTGESPPNSRGSSAFIWPVHGRILGSYGSRPDGTHNDGINIAAPRGAAIEATDAGIVAYTGNELHGYGNLILVKHPNGWISAYAHCDQLLVKRGEKVARGQVIARVGATGNVAEPQLHFELRRGHEAVDPREFLAPLPTAATKDSRSG
jgi:murein DD-endopeptidase MepM/ murein hydrolase activator NlpD